jgi:cell division protein FtsL
MHAPRRKAFNSVNAVALARWIVVTAFLALTGLIYVYLTLQLYHLGDRKKALENELASLRAQNDVASVQIAALTSRSAMQRRLKEGYLKMIPISENNIVRLSAPPRPLGEDAVQPIANKRAAR